LASILFGFIRTSTVAPLIPANIPVGIWWWYESLKAYPYWGSIKTRREDGHHHI